MQPQSGRQTGDTWSSLSRTGRCLPFVLMATFVFRAVAGASAADRTEAGTNETSAAQAEGESESRAWTLPARPGKPSATGQVPTVSPPRADAVGVLQLSDEEVPPSVGRAAGRSLELKSGATVPASRLAQFERAPGPFQPNPRIPEELRPRDSMPAPPVVVDEIQQPRLNALGVSGTPRPDEATLRRFDRFVERQVDPGNTLDLIVGRPRLVVFRTPPFRVQIGDEAVATYTVVTEREFSVTGNRVGSTILNFWFRNENNPDSPEILSYLLRVVPDPEAGQRQQKVLDALQNEINQAFPNSFVRLRYVGQEILVQGQAKDVEEASQILRIVSNNIPGDPPENDLDLFAPAIGANGFPVVPSAQLRVLGNLTEAQNAGGVRNALNGIGATGIVAANINRRIVNQLRIAGVHQVMLKVTVAEVNRSAARAIGANLNVESGESSSFFSFSRATGVPVPTAAIRGGRFSINRGDFELAINALKSINLARSLAEPELTTLNGQTAALQVGGSFPVPSSESFPDTGIVVQNVQYLPIGVQMAFTPVVNDKDRIRLSVVASVTTRTDATVEVQGTQVPRNLDTRTFTTTVELHDGQTLAVGGLLNTNLAASSDRVPFHGDIPIWGRLFREDNTSYDEQELVILVTPYLVAPYPEAEKPPLPGSDYFEPDDVEFYLLGRIESRYAEDYRTPVRNDIFKMREFRKCQQKFIVGPSGHSDGRH